MKKEWKKLGPTDQEKYEKQAEYLLEKGYVSDLTKEQLAKKIYEKE